MTISHMSAIPVYPKSIAKNGAKILFRYGYTVRQRKRKDRSKTVIYIEYRRD